jgi:hypothetical protein
VEPYEEICLIASSLDSFARRLQYPVDANTYSYTSANACADAQSNSATYASDQNLLISATDDNRYQQELHRYH